MGKRIKYKRPPIEKGCPAFKRSVRQLRRKVRESRTMGKNNPSAYGRNQTQAQLTDIDVVFVCPKCGRKYDPPASRCGKCGKDLIRKTVLKRG